MLPLEHDGLKLQDKNSLPINAHRKVSKWVSLNADSYKKKVINFHHL
jgi:hypothetical protein